MTPTTLTIRKLFVVVFAAQYNAALPVGAFLLIIVPFRFSLPVRRALAMVAYEDTYLTILDVDGPEWADKLRIRMHDKSTDLPTEQSWLLESIV